MGNKGRFYADIMAINPAVTGSCYPVVVRLPNNQKIIFATDCGMFQEEEYKKLNESFPFKAENIEFVLITHNHIDHIGRLPLLVKNGFRNNIYVTTETAKLLPLALNDSFKILRKSSKNKKKSLYSEDDVEKTLTLLKPQKFNEAVQVNEHIKVTFLKNGHLVGAAMILVQISYPGEEDINILFTGDYNSSNIFFDVNPIPNWILHLPLTIVQESTYGYVDSKDIEKCFRKNVQKCIAKGGSVVAPVFSIGRAQEVLYEIKCMKNDGEIPKELPIYLDGKLAIKYTRLYVNGELNIKEEMKDFFPQNLTFVDRSNRRQVLEDENSKIILTTSGMGSFGVARLYIPEYISRENALIHFTGYTAKGTLGRKLQDTKYNENVELGALVTVRRADVQYTSEFSKHAKADEIIEFLQQFYNLKLVLVTHGETEVKSPFANRIVKEVKAKRVGLLGKEYFFRINPYGLVKTWSSKF